MTDMTAIDFAFHLAAALHEFATNPARGNVVLGEAPFVADLWRDGDAVQAAVRSPAGYRESASPVTDLRNPALCGRYARQLLAL